MFICASTSPSRYSESRLIISPIAPSSPCWHRNVTPRAKFGSRSAGIAIRSWFVSGLDSAMAAIVLDGAERGVGIALMYRTVDGKFCDALNDDDVERKAPLTRPPLPLAGRAG